MGGNQASTGGNSTLRSRVGQMVPKRSLYAQNIKDPNMAEGLQATFNIWDQKAEGFQPWPPSPREPQCLRSQRRPSAWAPEMLRALENVVILTSGATREKQYTR